MPVLFQNDRQVDEILALPNQNYFSFASNFSF